MNNNHTPGPWVFAYGSVYQGNETINDENALRIALMDRNERRTQPTERDSNARLIAAAPELLDACMGMVEAYGNCECIDDSKPNHCPWCLARAAVTKAQGTA